MVKRSQKYKKKYLAEKYKRFVYFSRDFTTRMKQIRMINQMQVDAILRQIGFV